MSSNIVATVLFDLQLIRLRELAMLGTGADIFRSLLNSSSRRGINLYCTVVPPLCLSTYVLHTNSETRCSSEQIETGQGVGFGARIETRVGNRRALYLCYEPREISGHCSVSATTISKVSRSRFFLHGENEYCSE
jgi:hypothetical protein